MPKKERFPHDVDTEPGLKKPGTSGAAPKRHSQSAPTQPPPTSKRGKAAAHPTARPKNSSIKKRRAPHESDIPGATIDEVVADMSRDPRREKD